MLNVMVDIKEWTTEVCVSVVAFRERQDVGFLCEIFDREGMEESYFLSTWELFCRSNSSILAETPKLQRSNFWPFPTLARSKFVPSNQFLAVESRKIWSSILISVLVV